MVESFLAHECDIPLDGVEGVMGSTVRVRLKWEPQLLLHRRTRTSFMGTTRRTTTKLGTTAFNWSQPPKNTLSAAKLPAVEEKASARNIQSKLSDIASSSIAVVRSNKSQEIERPVSDFSKPSGGIVIVHIIEARGLKGDVDKLNPQVTVLLGKRHCLKTRKVKKTTSPYW